MALTKIGYTFNSLTTLFRASDTGIFSVGKIKCTRHTVINQKRVNALHLTSARQYPDAPTLPLPQNISEIFANETGRFTPERARDIAAPILIYGTNNANFASTERKLSFDWSNFFNVNDDVHVDSYDCFGAVSLNGIMQSNVPKPFSSEGKSTHLNMPGGEWSRNEKYIAEDIQNSHYRTTKLHSLQCKKNKDGFTNKIFITNTLNQIIYKSQFINGVGYSTSTQNPSDVNKDSEEKKQEILKLNKKIRFKRLLKEYGSTVFIFHVTISLISLGGIYAAVIRGIDLTPYVKMIVVEEESPFWNNIMNSSSQFVLAYTIHKVFAPIRFSITFAVTPLLVRYLRKIGVLKQLSVKPTMNTK